MCKQGRRGFAAGWIVPIGGAEEKENSPQILRRFVRLCGGDAADIVIIPTASRVADTGRATNGCSATSAQGASARSTSTAGATAPNPAVLERLQRATGVFFTGGNQLRLSTVIGGTPIAKAIRVDERGRRPRRRHQRGAAFISEHMIAFGAEGEPGRGLGQPGAGAGA